jgi:hypothetical protein
MTISSITAAIPGIPSLISLCWLRLTDPKQFDPNADLKAELAEHGAALRAWNKKRAVAVMAEWSSAKLRDASPPRPPQALGLLPRPWGRG